MVSQTLGPIQLLHEDDPGKLVRQGEGGQSPEKVRALAHLVRVPEGAAHKKAGSTLAAGIRAIEKVRKIQGAHVLAPLIQDNYQIPCLNGLEQPFALDAGALPFLTISMSFLRSSSLSSIRYFTEGIAILSLIIVVLNRIVELFILYRF